MNSRWKRGLSRTLVDEILNLNPEEVLFQIVQPKYIKCIIKTKNHTGTGISICSLLDEKDFNVRKGKNIAAGRAVKALKKLCTSSFIRSWETDARFPRTWTIGQANKLSALSHILGGFKSVFEFNSGITL